MSIYLKASPRDPRMEAEFPTVFGGPFDSQIRAKNYARTFRLLAQGEMDVPIRLKTSILVTDENIIPKFSYGDIYKAALAAVRSKYESSHEFGSSTSDEADDAETSTVVRQGALCQPVV